MAEPPLKLAKLDDEENQNSGVLFFGPTEKEDFFGSSELSDSCSKRTRSLLYENEHHSFIVQEENSEVLN